jgi:hypothetical protein
VVAGPQSLKTIREMQKKYRPDVVWAPITDESENKISLVQDRKSGERTTIYICSGGTCQLPVHTIREAEKLLTG